MGQMLLGAALALNGLTFVVFGWDKLKAMRRGHRVPEAHLIGLSALGGSLGGWLGMFVFRHKTAKPTFKVGMLVALLLNGLWAYLGYRYLG